MSRAMSSVRRPRDEEEAAAQAIRRVIGGAWEVTDTGKTPRQVDVMIDLEDGRGSQSRSRAGWTTRCAPRGARSGSEMIVATLRGRASHACGMSPSRRRRESQSCHCSSLRPRSATSRPRGFRASARGERRSDMASRRARAQATRIRVRGAMERQPTARRAEDLVRAVVRRDRNAHLATRST